MKKSLKILQLLFILLLIFIFLFSFINLVNADNDSVYKKTTSSKNNDTIYFQKPDDWGNTTPYIYAWDSYNSEPANKLGGAFPGIEMTLVSNNLYKYQFNTDTNYIKLVFSNGTSEKQTTDLDYICNGYIYSLDTKENLSFSPKYLKSGDSIKFEKPDSWDDTIYIYMWNSGNGNRNSDWHTKTMENENGNLYSYILSDEDWNVNDGFDLVIFSDNSNQTKDLSTVDSDIIFKANDSPIDSGNDYGKFDGIWVYTEDHINKLKQIVNQYTVNSEDIPFYTEDSYAIYDEQYNLAKEVINSSNVATSFYDLTSQYEKSKLAVPFAYNNLKIKTKILSDKITEMKNVDVTKYAPELVEAFDKTIEDADTILNDIDNITIPKMKDVISKMENAYNNLKVDKTELETLLNTAKNIDTSLYTNDSVTNLLNAINDSVNVLEDDEAGYGDVIEQIEKLNNSIAHLEKIENKKDNEDNEQTSNLDNSNKNTNSNKTKSDLISIINNPHTGDIILITLGIFIISTIGYILTRKYLKNNK